MMTVINRLIKEAKADPTPDFLRVQPNHVRRIAAHYHSTMSYSQQQKHSVDELEQHIKDGNVSLLGVKLKVFSDQQQGDDPACSGCKGFTHFHTCSDPAKQPKV